jgi:hypothetical protein
MTLKIAITIFFSLNILLSSVLLIAVWSKENNDPCKGDGEIKIDIKYKEINE